MGRSDGYVVAGAPVWVHGDIAAGNLLVDEKGALVSVIDFGCIGVGDPACDLTIAWTLFEGKSRRVFKERKAALLGILSAVLNDDW